ncbi:hypothetical protein D9M71_437090 [compost metagenome]
MRGAKRIAVGGDEFLLEDYYPRILTDEEFAELTALNSQRFRRRGKGEIAGVITGVGITRCGYCGAAVVAQNLMQRVKSDGSMEDGHRRLHCVSYSKNAGCNAGSCSSVPVERAVLAYCSDQMNLQRLLEPAAEGEDLRPRLAEAQARAGEIERQLERVTEALLADESGAAPLAFVRKARELEGELDKRRAVVQQLEQDLVAKSSSLPPAEAARWSELAERAKSMHDTGARDQARQLVMDTFESLVIYMRGFAPDRKSRHIDLMMRSRAGQTHWLRIDRRTGDWKGGGDWKPTQP